MKIKNRLWWGDRVKVTLKLVQHHAQPKDNKDNMGLPIIFEGHLNIACDNLAKAYWNETKHNSDNFTTTRVANEGSID